MRLESYASDCLEDAMQLSQQKALNSFSFRDCLNTMTELWGYCYEKIALIDPGYYSTCIRLTNELTHLPKCVRNTVNVFSARHPVGFTRRVYQPAGQNDMTAPFTYYISGNDLYCRDVRQGRMVWLEYVPEPPFVTFTKNNRNFKVLEGDKIPAKSMPIGHLRRYGMFELTGDVTMSAHGVLQFHEGRAVFKRMTPSSFVGDDTLVDITDWLQYENFELVTMILDHPYMFLTYRDMRTGDYESFIATEVLNAGIKRKYNPFDFTGRGSNVEILMAKFNDYTGEGVAIRDHNDRDRAGVPLVKYLGFTPDTLMAYPSRIMYNYMVAHVAQRLAAMNGATIAAVEMAVIQSEDEMAKFMKKNQSAWHRINNVTGPNMSDFL